MSRLGTNVLHVDTNHPNLARQITAEVREAMRAAGVSQRELSTLTGLPLVTLNRRLTGAGKPFDLDELMAVADALHLSLTDVVLRAERAALASTAA